MILVLITIVLVHVMCVVRGEGIKTVHVINSCHLDIGFADSSAGIVNRYFDSHFPRAIEVNAELRKNENYTDSKLNFMFQSWMIDLYLDCPVGWGLHCPNETQIRDFEDAIRNDVVTWHAFPHNAQLEIMGKTMIDLGLNLTFQLDDRFEKSRKKTLSQRDVPGLTRSLIPILASRNVTGITIGANDGSTPPNVPPCFRWVDPISGESMIVLFTWPGYGEIQDGSIHKKQMQCVVDGLEHALVYNWNGDNQGPFTSETYGEKWQVIQNVFPGAEIVASTFDNFTQHLYDPDVYAKLPVVTKEMGDSWIYGVPSDPQKVQRMRVMNREWTKYLQQHSMDDDLRNATRFFLKAGEHTWGKDVKSYLSDNNDWSNKDFEEARSPSSNVSSQYMTLESSWWEQRSWGITTALDTLEEASHPLGKMVRDEFETMKPVAPNTEHLKIGHVDTMYSCGDDVKIQFDSAGAVSFMSRNGHVWANESRSLFELKYRSYSAENVSSFFSQYCKSNASWVAHDYGKPGLPSSVVGKIFQPQVRNLYVNTSSETSCIFVIESSFDDVSSVDYGAPSQVWTTVTINNNDLSSMNVEIDMFNKTTTRIPEAMFVQFRTPDENATWSANKLGSWIDPSDIVDGGTKHLHGVTEDGLRVQDGDSTMQISSIDAAVANFGKLDAYPSPVHETADTSTYGSSYVLWDNLWGTNYVMWWPFVVPPPSPYTNAGVDFPIDGNSNIKYRFSLTFD